MTQSSLQILLQDGQRLGLVLNADDIHTIMEQFVTGKLPVILYGVDQINCKWACRSDGILAMHTYPVPEGTLTDRPPRSAQRSTIPGLLPGASGHHF